MTTMTDVHYAGHIAIPSSKRDPRPRTEGSWWIGKSREDLNRTAHELWPNATAGESYSGVLYLAAEKHGLVG